MGGSFLLLMYAAQITGAAGGIARRCQACMLPLDVKNCRKGWRSYICRPRSTCMLLMLLFAIEICLHTSRKYLCRAVTLFAP